MSAGTSTDTTAGGSVISLPQGGGAVNGLGEKFSPDLFTGTGNFSVPMALPPGRNGMAPQLSLAYSTGNGNGPFGLGWTLSLPGVARKTSRGVPRYDGSDVFVLSGAEDLVPVPGAGAGRQRHRPRTEGLFARIEHVQDQTGDYWEVWGKDGIRTRYGTPRPAGADTGWRDPGAVAAPDAARVFAWRITETADPLGNLVRYRYLRDQGQEPGHRWDQPLVVRIDYADYGDRADPSFLVGVEFFYEPRPDPFSDHRAGFEVRCSLRCRAIRVTTHAADGVVRVVREYRFTYTEASFNGVSLLTRIDVVGIDESAPPDQREQALPPLTFDYSGFEPAGRRFERVTGAGLPTGSLSDPTLTLVDLHGFGLPDVLELGPQVRRYWRNAGGGRLELPRTLSQAPPVSLADPGVQVLDADGDGRPDLMVTGVGAQAGVNGGTGLTGYVPMTFPAGWSQRTFQPYRQAPSVGPGDPASRLVDLTGDGLTDILHSGSRLLAFLNDRDPDRAWSATVLSNGTGPQVDLTDPRIRLADMTGDGLQDLVLVRNGNVVYWPNLGFGRWGDPVAMRGAPRLPDGFDPRRVLLGDLDGDGLADLIYVDRGRVLLWGNRSGTEFTADPVTVHGTPGVVDTDAIQLADLHGTGMAGLLYTRPADATGASGWRFLDLTGGIKPYLLTGMDNHLGATTTVTYSPSTAEYLRDQADPATRWRTTLPFPVQVVSRVEVRDAHSGGRLVTQYRYHHGYWDGVEREFRGFAMVEQLDTQTFEGTQPPHASPPLLSKNWFSVGPVAAVEAGDWTELDLRSEYWDGDPPTLGWPPEMQAFLAGLSRADRRDGLRTLRGQLLRSELYALDGTARQHRPYTVTEALVGIREESRPGPGEAGRARIFFSFPIAQRTTQWERGDDPMIQFQFTTGYDEYGFATQQLTIAVPRGRDPRQPHPAAARPYLATYTTTEYARRDDADRYLVDRIARTTSYEVRNDGRPDVFTLRDTVLAGPASGSPVSLRVLRHSRTFYDGPAHEGLPLRQVGAHGLVVRAESLALAEGFLDELFDPADPLAVTPRPTYLNPDGTPAWSPEYPEEFRALLPERAGYVHHGDADVPGSPGGYYIVGTRHRYDVHDPARVPRGLLLGSLDELGAESRIAYDEHDLLPTRTTDPAGLVTEATIDPRVLQPREVTDANGNTSSVTFSPAGLVTSQYVRGKHGEGDATLPSVRMDYKLLAFAEHGQPVSVRSVRRVHHDTQTDVPAEQRDEVIVSVKFSDGFGRLLQTRTQAEDTLFGDPAFGGGVLPAEQGPPVPETTGRARQPGDADNVVVSGWQTYDNKGRIVEKYEPFFATGYEFAPPVDAQLGQKATISYDPRGHAVRTVNPDGSEQRVIFGVPVDLADPDVFAPAPWESFTYDANDNAGRTHGPTAEVYRSHWNTPASTELDALGRQVVAVARNGPDPDTDWYVTRSTHDLQGNLIGVTDALGREAFTYRFDLAGRRWRTNSIDAGRCDTVPDALGAVVESRDSKGSLTLSTFDVLRRPTRVWARDGTGEPVTLRQRVEYGDAGDPAQPTGDRAAARARNLLGQAVAHYDEAGLATVNEVDFKGNVVDSARRVIADAAILAVYERAATDGWRVRPFAVDWQAGTGDLLEPTEYRTTTSFDALNRMTRHVLPVDVEGRRRELVPRYNRAGGLEQIRLDDAVYVQRIAYDAKGQRTLIAYGNGVLTRCAYDPRTFRLVRLRSEHYTVDGLTYQPSGPAIQDNGYEYDLAGNILTIRDRTPGSGVPNTPAGPDALDRRFTYDPIYRLLTATGRECDLPPDHPPWLDAPRCTDLTRTRAYTETYRYDAMGSMLRLSHTSGSDGFVRDFTVESATNRLERMTIGGTPFDYRFDATGNMVAETTSRHFNWNHADRLAAFATQTAGAEPSLHAHYLYDAAGERVKKLVRRQGGAVEATHYVGDVEHHRWGGSAAGENSHVHVMDDSARIALVRVGPAAPGAGGVAVQFHLGDHLRSSVVVVDEASSITNREELTPYGETSFGSFARKRYRFTGKERDEESALNYHNARHFAPYLCRWISPDPVGPTDSMCLYQYARSNPVYFTDTEGQDSDSPVDHSIRTAGRQMELHYKRATAYQAKPATGENGAKARAEIAKYWKWSEERDFLIALKAVQEFQVGVGLSYDQYPVTRKDPDTGAISKDNRWRQTSHRQSFAGTGEKEGSFCLGASRSMAIRTIFGFAKPSYSSVLTDLKTRIEAARSSGSEAEEASAIISRIVSHSNGIGSVAQFNEDLEGRYGLKNAKVKSVEWKEAFAALKLGAPIIAGLKPDTYHWVLLSRSPQGDLWANDPLIGYGVRQISTDELSGAFEIVVDATTGKPITPAQARGHEKNSP
jgi:RHS repeat-associated protein